MAAPMPILCTGIDTRLVLYMYDNFVKFVFVL